MVEVFDKDGHMRGATVIETGPCLITQIKTTDRDGYNDPETRAEFENLLVQGYFVKPLNLDSLADAVLKCLKELSHHTEVEQ